MVETLFREQSSANDLLADAIVWDNHACMPMDMHDNLAFLPKLEEVCEAGVTVLSINIGYGEVSLSDHFALAEQMRAWITAHPDRFMMIDKARDVAEAKRSGRLGIVFDIEGAAPLAGDLSLVEQFYRRGVRWMLLAYNRRNWAASGVHDDDVGLSQDGYDLIREMERVGMVVCLSHTAPRSAFDALRYAKKPMIFSHSNLARLAPHPRNISDDLARACADTGGVIGVNGLEIFLNGGVTAERLADHVEALAQVVGIDHVGIGLDHVFDIPGLEREKQSMIGAFPPDCGYETPTRCFPPTRIDEIVEVLLQRGWHGDDLHKLLGGNWLRVAQKCWAT
ncbi:MAG: membrane dipeptidase [Erythrobacter sp.]|uniref:dipeptidase n=1 Tax=Erythrobacter sp. TaxID=1042 RepID=UPI00263683D5|nr:membrane dipeptidase [Erythrobacter sp.]MDJ0978180.1 membrane dipeptidase [Erythrobacter sp.]